jgi:hypothetical protein
VVTWRLVVLEVVVPVVVFGVVMSGTGADGFPTHSLFLVLVSFTVAILLSIPYT